MNIIAKGIDVSTFQGNIDWARVKKDGVQFAMLRGGFGRYETDEQFEKNYEGAKAAGVPVGVYHYTYADTVDKAVQEADFCISYLKGKQLEYPIAFDIEDASISNLTKALLTEIVTAFCDRVEKAGYYVVVYASKSWFTSKLNKTKLTRFDKWVAQWSEECTYTDAYGLWQYSNSGNIKGISGRVDLDYAYKDYPTIIKNAGLNGFSKPSTKPTAPTKPTTPTKPATPSKPTAKTFKQGDAVKLVNTPLYSSSESTKTAIKKTGTYYIYDGELLHGKYRITIAPKFCGRKPVYLNVTGWVAESDIV